MPLRSLIEFQNKLEEIKLITNSPEVRNVSKEHATLGEPLERLQDLLKSLNSLSSKIMRASTSTLELSGLYFERNTPVSIKHITEDIEVRKSSFFTQAFVDLKQICEDFECSSDDINWVTVHDNPEEKRKTVHAYIEKTFPDILYFCFEALDNPNWLKHVTHINNQHTHFDPEDWKLSIIELKLSELDLEEINRVKDIFQNIQKLSLNDIGLDDLGNIIIGLPALSELDLSNNNLLELPIWFHKLSELQVLNISNNYFEDFPPILTSLPKLRKLDISGNLFGDDEASFAKMKESLPNCEIIY